MSPLNIDVLAYLKKVAAQSDATVEAARRQLEYSRVLVARARTRTPPALEEAAMDNSPERPPDETPVRPSVLVLENDGDSGEMYAVALAMAGFQPVVAGDLATARMYMDHDLPMAVVLETSHLDGENWHLVRELKADARTRDIPVIVITSRMENAFSGTALERGCTSVLLKPCLPNTLVSVIRSSFSHAGASADDKGNR